MKNNLQKNFIWNTIGSLLNASTSLFFLIIVTRINGINDAGIFTFAFSVSCLLEVFGTYFGRTYQVTETNENFTDQDFIYHRFFTCGIMFLLAIFYILIKGYSTYKIIIILLLTFYKLIEAFSESIYAIIQKNNDLYKVGISLFLKAILSFLIFLILDYLSKNLIISIIGIIIINLIILYFYDIKNIKNYKYRKTEFNFENIKKLFKYGFFTFLFTVLTQYIINASKFAIDNNMADNFQTIFGIIIMPATLISLFSQFMIQPFLMHLTNNIKNNQIKKFLNLIIKIEIYIVLFGLVASVIVYLIGIPFLEMIYGVELSSYLYPLVIIICGATLFAMASVLSNALITMRKTLVQSVIFTIASIIALFVSNLLVNLKGILGASISYTLIMFLILLMYIFVFINELRKEGRNV